MVTGGDPKPGCRVSDGAERLIRRGRRKGSQRYILDQLTGLYRPPAAAFEPRLPETRPGAKQTDRYLSVNIWSSLRAAGLPQDWRSNNDEVYGAALDVAACERLNLQVTWEPVTDQAHVDDNNPHHGGIQGVVEIYRKDRDAYERTITALAKAAEVLPECIRVAGPA